MTTLLQITLLCPICANSLTTHDVLNKNALGGKRTDFHERAVGSQPLPHLIHTCPQCGFTGSKGDFDDQGEFKNVDRVMFRQFLSEITVGLNLKELTAAEKYELAAKIGVKERMSQKVIAFRYLHAAWACVDDKDTEAERFYRIKAAEHLEAFLAQTWISEDELNPDTLAVLYYLTGEIWRRAGFVKHAHTWFYMVEDQVVDAQKERWVVDAAKQQRDCPREWFG